MTASRACARSGSGSLSIRRQSPPAIEFVVWGTGMHFESDDLEALRETTSRTLLFLLWLHVPVVVIVGTMRGADWMAPTAVLVAMALAATLSWRAAGNGLSTRLLIAVALMGAPSLLVFEMSGHSWQADTHMYFFALLATLVAYCDYRPIIIGAVYPGGSDLGLVVLHAVILLMEAGVLIWLTHKLTQLFAITAQKTAEA